MHLAVLIDIFIQYLPNGIKRGTCFICIQFTAMYYHTISNYYENYHVSAYTAVSIYMCVLMSVYEHLYRYVHLRWSVYVIQGLKASKILCWLYSAMLLLWVSVRRGWLDSLVLDNCTLPRSVVPFSVSLWPRLQEPYLGCTSSSSYPVSSPSCPTHPHNTAGGR